MKCPYFWKTIFRKLTFFKAIIFAFDTDNIGGKSFNNRGLKQTHTYVIAFSAYKNYDKLYIFYDAYIL